MLLFSVRETKVALSYEELDAQTEQQPHKVSLVLLSVFQ